MDIRDRARNPARQLFNAQNLCAVLMTQSAIAVAAAKYSICQYMKQIVLMSVITILRAPGIKEVRRIFNTLNCIYHI